MFIIAFNFNWARLPLITKKKSGKWTVRNQIKPCMHTENEDAHSQFNAIIASSLYADISFFVPLNASTPLPTYSP